MPTDPPPGRPRAVRELPDWPGYGLGPAPGGRVRVYSRRLNSGRVGSEWRELKVGETGRLQLRRRGRTLSVAVADLAKGLEDHHAD